jgi:prolipoprotein diacylglyceryl transferase
VDVATSQVLAAIPSPTANVWHLGPLPLRAYALCIILGIVAAVVITDRRLRARGGPAGVTLDIAVWAVPFGILGARIYHVLTSWQPYFGPGGNPFAVIRIWEGGLGIWGAVAGGAMGALIACRRRRLPLAPLADSAAVGLPVAQAIGRLGNWFNNELYGRATDLPWGLTVHEMDPATGRALTGPDGEPIVLGTYHPTFLYELVWDLGVAGLVLWADRRFRLGRGRAFVLYVMAYTAGRLWIELLRVDPANTVLGLRLNVWTSIIVFLGALAAFVLRRGPREVLETSPDGTVVVRGPESSVEVSQDPSGDEPGGKPEDASEGEPGDEPEDEPVDAPAGRTDGRS